MERKTGMRVGKQREDEDPRRIRVSLSIKSHSMCTENFELDEKETGWSFDKPAGKLVELTRQVKKLTVATGNLMILGDLR